MKTLFVGIIPPHGSGKIFDKPLQTEHENFVERERIGEHFLITDYTSFDAFGKIGAFQCGTSDRFDVFSADRTGQICGRGFVMNHKIPPTNLQVNSKRDKLKITCPF